MWKSRRGRCVMTRAAVLCTGGAMSVGGAAVGGPVNVFWQNPVDGFWGVAANWNPAVVPNNFGGNEFNAFIQVTGAPFTVSLDQNFTIRDFTITSADATLNLLGRRLTVEGAFVQGGSTITGDGGLGELFVSGASALSGATLTGFQTLRAGGDLTLSGTTFNGVMAVMSQSTLNFIGTAANEICDTCVDHEGLAINWSGDGGIMMGGGGEIRNGAASTFTISNASSITLIGGSAAVRNAGTIVKTSAGTTSMVGVSLDNTGALDVGDGVFSADTVQNLSAGTLTGGKWTVRAGASLDFVGGSVQTNEAEVTLDGVGSSFSALTDNLAVNGAAGSISLENGRNFTTAGGFTNDGKVRVGAGSTFRVAPGSGLSNFNAGTKTLSGGEYDLAGNFVFDGADVVTLTADATLRGGEFRNQSGANALFQSSAMTNTIGAGGRLGVRDGVTFTTGGDMFVAAGGLLDIGVGTTFKVADGFDLLNISPTGVLNDAGIILKGTLQASNADIVEIGSGADLTLDGDGSQLLNGAGQSAFLGLERIDSGVLTVKGGRNLTVSNTTTPFTVSGATGQLNVGPSEDTDGPIPGMGTVFTVTGNAVLSAGGIRVDDAVLSIGGATGLTQTGGMIALAEGGVIEFTGGGGLVQTGGTLAGAGSIMGDITAAGTVAPGASTGVLAVTGDVSFLPTSALEIDIVSATEFDRLAIDGGVMFTGVIGVSGATLRVTTTGYTPTLGDTFEVLTFTEPRTGGFDVLEGLSLGQGFLLDVKYIDHALVLTVVPAPSAGVLAALSVFWRVRRRRGAQK